MTKMDAKDLKAELDAAEEILRTATIARIAYDGIDGTPRVVPIGFLWTGDAVVVATHATSPKFAALRARPRVALTIDTPSPPRSLLLRGDAEIEVVDGPVPSTSKRRRSRWRARSLPRSNGHAARPTT